MEDKSAVAREMRQQLAEALCAETTWHESAILREMRRQLEEFPCIIDCYYANPCPETFAPMQQMHEHQRQQVAQTEQQAENLRQMVEDIAVWRDSLGKNAANAEAAGNTELAERLTQEQVSWGNLQATVAADVREADELLVMMQEAFGREEARMAREAARLASSGS